MSRSPLPLGANQDWVNRRTLNYHLQTGTPRATWNTWLRRDRDNGTWMRSLLPDRSSSNITRHNSDFPSYFILLSFGPYCPFSQVDIATHVLPLFCIPRCTAALKPVNIWDAIGVSLADDNSQWLSSLDSIKIVCNAIDVANRNTTRVGQLQFESAAAPVGLCNYSQNTNTCHTFSVCVLSIPRASCFVSRRHCQYGFDRHNCRAAKHSKPMSSCHLGEMYAKLLFDRDHCQAVI